MVKLFRKGGEHLVYDFKQYINNGFTFIKIPNDLFYMDNKGGSFMELIDYNLLIVLTYIKTKKTIINEVFFSIGELVKFCGLKVNSDKGKSVDKMKNIVKFLIDKDYIDCDIDVNTIKVNDFIKAKVTKEEENKFTVIPLSVIDKILNSNYRNRNKILTYWCYLHSRVYKKTNAGDSKAQVTWVSMDKIGLDIGLSNETIKNYNDILVELGLLKYINLGTKKKGKLKEKCSNIYITIDGSISNEFVNIYLKEGVNQYKHYLKENGWTLIEKKGDIKNE